MAATKFSDRLFSLDVFELHGEETRDLGFNEKGSHGSERVNSSGCGGTTGEIPRVAASYIQNTN